MRTFITMFLMYTGVLVERIIQIKTDDIFIGMFLYLFIGSIFVCVAQDFKEIFKS